MAVENYITGTGGTEQAIVTYSPIDKKSWIYQPNLVRWRHRSRGPRESLKINQEITQTYYDLYTLCNKLDVLASNHEFIIDIMVDGGEVEDVEVYWDEQVPMVLDGIDSLSADIEALRKRVRMLEG